MNHKQHSLLLFATLLAASVSPLAAKGSDDSGIKFYGLVSALPSSPAAGSWTVGGKTIWVASSTILTGTPSVGSCVEIQGAPRADGSVDASRVSIEDAARCSAPAPAPSPSPSPSPTPTPDQPSFFGSVTALPASGWIGTWTVGNRSVIVSASTRIRQDRGPAGLGSCVEVTGSTAADNSIVATEIEIESGSAGCASAPENERLEVEFLGTIQALPPAGGIGSWTVSGRAIRVSSATVLQSATGGFAVGTCMEVKGRFASDGVIDATAIKSDDSCHLQSANGGNLSFVGNIQSLPASGLAGDWMVSSRVVHVSAQSDLRPGATPFAANSCVEVSGEVQADGSLRAGRITSEDAGQCGGVPQAGRFELEGIVESVPPSGTAGDWTISGRTVRVSAATVLDTEHAPLVVGACVEVQGATAAAGGVIEASVLESKAGSGTCVVKGGVLNAASFVQGAVAPGQMVAVFGLNLGPASPRTLQVAEDHVVTRLDNVRVLFNGIAAPLVMASSGQVNAIVPFGIDDSKPVEVQVENNGVWSNTERLSTTATAPALFTLQQTGRGPAVALNYDDSTGGYYVNGSSAPIRRGGYLVTYATGAGRMEPEMEDGRIVSGSVLPKPVAPVEVTVGGRRADVQYAGAAPGMVAGVLQINIRIPDDAPQGDDVPMVVKIGEKRSDDSVTISVR